MARRAASILHARAFAAKSATHVRRDHAHLLRRDIERTRDLRFEREWRLRAGPHRDLAVLHHGTAECVSIGAWAT